MRRRLFPVVLPALLLGPSGCSGEDCSAEPYYRALDLAGFCSISSACTMQGVGTAAHDSHGDDPSRFGVVGTSTGTGVLPTLAIDLTALDDVIRTRPFLGIASYTTAYPIPDPAQFHFDGVPCVAMDDPVPDGQDYACEIPRGAAKLTFEGRAEAEAFMMYLYGVELAAAVTCAV